MNSQQSDLGILGYTQQWLDYGVLTNEQLQTQLTKFSCGDDHHTEHYRYQTLSGYIKAKSLMNDREVSNLLALTVDDPDSTMASSVIILLLKRAFLTDKQFNTVALALTTFGDWTQKEIKRQCELRR